MVAVVDVQVTLPVDDRFELVLSLLGHLLREPNAFNHGLLLSSEQK